MKNLKSNLIIISAITFGVLLIVFANGGAASENLPALKNIKNAETIEQSKQNIEYDSLAAAIRVARYSVEENGGKIYADNPANKMRAVFEDAGGFRLHSSNENFSWQTDWKLKSVGRGAEQTAVGGGVWQSSENRVEMRRDEIGLTEYFENRPNGLEQVFVIDKNPSPESLNAENPLRFVLGTSGDLNAVASADGQTVDLKNSAGEKVLHYEKLKVWDADGTILAAKMRTETAGEVWLEVEDANAVYPLTIDPTFVNQKKLTSGDGAASDFFGTSVAVSGSIAVVGAPDDDVNNDANRGSVYIFTRNGLNWTQTQKLIASDGTAGDRFGYDVDLGSKIIVGAPFDNFGANLDQGSAYEFVFNSQTNTWLENRKLSSSDGTAGDRFGFSVSLGQFILIGSPGSDVGGNNSQGAVYRFANTGTTEVAKATASDGGANDNLGYSITEISYIGGNGVIAGAPFDDISTAADRGSAYIFQISSSSFTQRVKITAADGAANDNFGKSVGCPTTGKFCVGAPNDDIGNNADQGSVYVFNFDGNSLTQQAKLTANDGAAGDLFGESVGKNGVFTQSNDIIIGAPSDDIGANTDQGSAYVFIIANNTMTWLQNAKITATDGAANDNFGKSVAANGQTVIVGADKDDVAANANQGSAYVFVRKSPFDFAGNGKSNYAVFRPSNGTWYISGGSFFAINFGLSTDLLAPGDYDGDTKTDVAVFRPSNGIWYIQQSTAGFIGINFGTAGDLPRPGDFDGDGKADISVFRPSNGTWYRLNSSNNQFAAVQFGTNGDRPVIADFDGDGKTDIAVFRPSTGVWYWLNSSDNQFNAVQFGISSDIPLPADFDGDGRSDLAVFRGGNWYVQQSTLGFAAINYGLNTDIPAVGDYDGDGKANIAVFRNGNWYQTSFTGAGSTTFIFGTNGDRPIPAAFNQ